MCKPEVWGGIECTINRIGDQWLDQFEMSGHYIRKEDLDHIAELGIKTLRYPILWERHQPDEGCTIDFTWIEARLNQLRFLGIDPIAGLLHHGSGPKFTNLLDQDFPTKFASYAKAVATKFPWIDKYTPVNEPLTTARFSGLYGLWYPHKRNDVSCMKMLLNELKGTVLAMQEIRKINPSAKLVQTEDMGKTYSTPLLSYQAKFENERRWLTFDLLCGKVNKKHPLYNYFMRLGIPADMLAFFTDNPMPPDIMGINYYVTSERYLDQRILRYPKSTHGGNTLHEYADVEAVRVDHRQTSGFKVIMKEVWDRYRLPVAVTEAHLHCAREEQMKWFKEIFDQSTELLEEGVTLLAVTNWSMLGAYGWNKLLTTEQGDYERGAFDVSAGYIRPTAMASMIQTIIETGEFHSPLLNSPGWWRSPLRFFSERNTHSFEDSDCTSAKPILIVGKNGTLGRAFARICNHRGLPFKLLSRNEVEISNLNSVTQAIATYKPWVVINAAGFVRVDEAEEKIEDCDRDNAEGPKQLAKACLEQGIKFLTFSSDLVFDGKKEGPYLESDDTNPLNAYGRSKANAEKFVSEIHPSSLIIRTSAFFGPWDKYNFISDVFAHIDNGRIFTAVADATISPTYVPHLVNACLDLIIDNEQGIWHVSNNDAITWYEFACLAAKMSERSTNLIHPVYNVSGPAEMPVNSVLQSEKGVLLPSLESALKDYLEEISITT